MKTLLVWVIALAAYITCIVAITLDGNFFPSSSNSKDDCQAEYRCVQIPIFGWEILGR